MLSDQVILRGVPGHLRCDSGTGFVAMVMREWVKVAGRNFAHTEPGNPSENCNCRGFNATFSASILIYTIFYLLAEATVRFELWRRRCKTRCPYSLLYLRQAASEVLQWPVTSFVPNTPPKKLSVDRMRIAFISALETTDTNSGQTARSSWRRVLPDFVQFWNALKTTARGMIANRETAAPSTPSSAESDRIFRPAHRCPVDRRPRLYFAVCAGAAFAGPSRSNSPLPDRRPFV